MTFSHHHQLPVFFYKLILESPCITGDLVLAMDHSLFYRCTLDTDKFDISINVFSLNLVMFQLY
jgi:hypothetical protein